jgi:3-oxoacyl-(acyl-carrier-protein) synthase/acyl carrier protein
MRSSDRRRVLTFVCGMLLLLCFLNATIILCMQAILSLEEWRFFSCFSLNYGLVCAKSVPANGTSLDQGLGITDGPFGLPTVQEAASEPGLDVVSSCEPEKEISTLIHKDYMSLEACAVIGLVPNPSTAATGRGGLEGLSTAGMQAQWLELEQVPFMVRRASIADIPSLLQLQAFMDPEIHRSLLSYKDLDETIDKVDTCAWVVEAGGKVLSAVVMIPHESTTGKTFSMVLMGVYPSLDDKWEILYALWGFIIEYTALMEACRSNEWRIEQGNLKVLGLLGRSSECSSTSVLLRFVGSGKFTVTFDNVEIFPFIQSMQNDPSVERAHHHHKITLEDILSVTLGGWVALQASNVHGEVLRLGQTTGMVVPGKSIGEIGDNQSRRHSIVDEVRRITATFEAHDMDENEAEAIVQVVMETVVDYMEAAELSTTSLNIKTSLGDAGLDSLDMLRLAGILSESLNVALPSTILFDYPSVETLSTYLVAALGISDAFRKSKTGEERVPDVHKKDNATLNMDECFNRRRSSSFLSKWNSELATLEVQGRRTSVIGTVGTSATLVGSHVITIESSSTRLPANSMSGMRQQGISSSSFEFASPCMEVDAPSTIPLERWDLDDVDVVQAGRFGAFLSEDVGAWDCQAFGVNVTEASHMDPQQRILLECAYEVVYDYSKITTSSSPVGVHIGASYAEHLQKTSFATFTGYTASGGALSVLAGRISYVYGFTGPCMVADTACSSALVAMAAAHNSLRLGQCVYDMAGAINLMLTPATTAMYAAAGMLTLDGRCKTLDEAADGYVRSEAAAMYALKLTINSGVTRGNDSPSFYTKTNSGTMALLSAAVNQDGRSSSLTAPNGPAQQVLIASALKQAHVEASKISVLQLHGTGTALGDPIEVHAATKVLTSAEGCTCPLSLEASKSSFGHAEPSAGAISLTCTITSLHSQGAPPVMHLRAMNVYVSQSLMGNAKRSNGVFVSKQSTSICHIEKKDSTFASISGFAFQGTNAHVIVQRAAEPEEFSIMHILNSIQPVIWDKSQHVRGSYHITMPFIRNVMMQPLSAGRCQGRGEICSFMISMVNSPSLLYLKDCPWSVLGAGLGVVASAASMMHRSTFYSSAGGAGAHNTAGVPLLLNTSVMDVPIHSMKSLDYAQCDVILKSGMVELTAIPADVEYGDGSQVKNLLRTNLNLSSAICPSALSDQCQTNLDHDPIRQVSRTLSSLVASQNCKSEGPSYYAEIAPPLQRSSAVPYLSYLLESMLQVRLSSVVNKSDNGKKTTARLRVAAPAIQFSGNLISGKLSENFRLIGCEMAYGSANNHVRIHELSHSHTLEEVAIHQFERKRDRVQAQRHRHHSRSHYVTSWQVIDPLMTRGDVSEGFKFSKPGKACSMIGVRLMEEKPGWRSKADQRLTNCIYFDSGIRRFGEKDINPVAETANILQALQGMSTISRHMGYRTKVSSVTTPLVNGMSIIQCGQGSTRKAHLGLCYASALRCAFNEDQELFDDTNGGVNLAFIDPKRGSQHALFASSPHDGDVYGRVETAHTLLRPRLLSWTIAHKSNPSNPSNQFDLGITTWAITGGTGGLGSLVASYLSNVQRNIIVLGRSGRMVADWLIPKCTSLLVIHR